MASKSKFIAELLDANGDVLLTNLDNINVYDADTSSTGYFDVPTGTTAQRPVSPNDGYTRLNTTIGSLEYYSNGSWVQTNYVPNITSISGAIVNGQSSDLTINISNATSTVDVVYKEGSTTLATTTGVTVTGGVATATVPSAVYSQTTGDTISISVVNDDGVPSVNSVNKIVTALATGGTVTSSGSYFIHTFTTSSTFTVPTGGLTADILVVGGGGGGNPAGGGGGGGGAGGYRYFTSQSLTAGAKTITVGAGGGSVTGASYVTPNNPGTYSAYDDGGAAELRSSGGGSGRSDGNVGTSAGGSGGGGSGGYQNAGGSGNAGGYTPSEGNNGGNGSGSPYAAGGGGGAGGVGGNGSAPQGGVGGVGSANSISGSSVYYAGGGGGGGNGGSTSSGGLGGGGNGPGGPNGSGTSGTANTGGGGGGASFDSSTPYSSGAGGSGVVIIRYIP